MAMDAAPPSKSTLHVAKVEEDDVRGRVVEAAAWAEPVRGRVCTATADVDSPGDKEGLWTTG